MNLSPPKKKLKQGLLSFYTVPRSKDVAGLLSLDHSAVIPNISPPITVEPIPPTNKNVTVVAQCQQTFASNITDISTSFHDAPVQPVLNDYPKTSRRRFNAGYFAQFHWIEYSLNKDAVFCFCCRHFSSTSVYSGETQGNIAFIDYGFKKWKDAKALLTKHANSSRHKSSMTLWLNAKKVLNEEMEPIANQINAQRKEQILENRQHLKYLIQAVSYLTRQGLAFRGNDETAESVNKGNFVELLELLSATNPLLRERMNNRYGHYSSHEYQNDIISCLAKTVRKSVINSIGSFWALLVDESKDVSRKEQLSFCIRSISKDGNVFEKPLGVIHMKKLNAEALASAINVAVIQNNLSWDNCVGQCYDGASVMSGQFTGVQARIKEIAPHVTYIHCHAHRLNLVLVRTIKNIPEIAEFFEKVQCLYVFLTVSTPRHELFLQAQKEYGLTVIELERLVETRWYYWYRSVRKIKLRICSIAVVLETISNQNADLNVANDASGLLCHVTSTRFLRCLIIVETLLGKVNTLSEELQNPKINYLTASSLIHQIECDLQSIRTNEFWNTVLNEADTLRIQIIEVTLCDAAPATHSRRRPVLSKKLTDFFVLSTTGKKDVGRDQTDEDALRANVFYTCIDKFLHELNERFSKNSCLLKNISIFETTSPSFLAPECASNILQLYPTSGIDPIVIDSQLQSAKSYIVALSPVVLNVQELRSHLNTLPKAFSEVVKLIDLVLTIPVTSVENERFFSCMKRVKTYLRNACEDERLSDLLILNCLQEETKSVDIEEVINEFSKIKQRRYPLM